MCPLKRSRIPENSRQIRKPRNSGANLRRSRTDKYKVAAVFAFCARDKVNKLDWATAEAVSNSGQMRARSWATNLRLFGLEDAARDYRLMVFNVPAEEIERRVCRYCGRDKGCER